MGKFEQIFRLKIFFVSILLFAIVVIVFFLSYEPKQTETLELARRITSQSKQKNIFSKIEEYYGEHEQAPTTLSELVGKGYLNEEDILAPPILKDS